MIEGRQGWILGLAKTFRQEDVEEVLEEAEQKAHVKKVNHGIENPTVTIDLKNLIPEWRKRRIRKDMVQEWEEPIDKLPEYKETVVHMMYEESIVFKCSIEEFDKVFFE